MSGTEQNKPGGKSGRRNRKPEQQRIQKPDQQRSPKQAQQPEAKELIEAAVASTAAASTAAIASTGAPPTIAAPPADASPIGFQTIATAYSDYTRKSLEEARCFVEKLSGVRSLDKALEIQAEFAKRAYETFVADSQKIRELYTDLARQTFKPSKSTRATR